MVPPWMGYSMWKFWVIRVLVCRVFLIFLVFSTTELISQWENSEFCRLSVFIDFFAWICIVWHRYELHLTYFIDFNHFWGTLKMGWSWTRSGPHSCTVSYGTLNSFQVDFFTQYGAMSFWLFFGHFWAHLDLELHLDGALKCPKYLFPLPEVCYGTLTCF